mmetsp:Transcript_18691/g.60917  ORF Transcript_18691/g.60917 Transcript_18691/m.60917 type:complete len:743 (-) Transcript_18691:14-2242(-)
MLRGALLELEEIEVDEWTNQALTWELTLPEVHQAISVSAWPSLCELLGRLPDCVTPAELQEALWQQSFVENPTHAPDHRNYRRFALLAAQMVAIGVELESNKVEMLVQQTLELDRPWRERRDVLSGILSAASVENRVAMVRNLDRRFEEHADIDDFEIVCGIAEHIGVEIPRDGAIRRCALRRWALDPKRGGVLPVARLIDFVDTDASIGEEVATNLRSKGRVADAALLLSRLPQDCISGPAGDSVGTLDVNNGDAELARLRELLSMDDDLGANNGLDGRGVFGPIEEGGAFRLPLLRGESVGFVETAEEALEAAGRMASASLLAIGLWREEAPFWYAPPTLVALCAEDHIELFDLPSLRRDESGTWPEAANRLRALLSNPRILKIVYGDDVLHVLSFALGLGIASTLRRADRDLMGPWLDTRALMASVLDCAIDDALCAWPSVAGRFLGLRLCPEEAGSNFARRPLRESQLHFAAAEAWTQLPVLRALCAHQLVPGTFVRQHLSVQTKMRAAVARKLGGKAHVLGQLAPPGRLAEGAGFALVPSGTAGGMKSLFEASENAAHQAKLPTPTRIAALTADVPAEEDGQPALTVGSLVEVFDERFGGMAHVKPAGHDRGSDVKLRRVPVGALQAFNSWLCPAWLASLPRPSAFILAEASARAATADAELAARRARAASSASRWGGGTTAAMPPTTRSRSEATSSSAQALVAAEELARDLVDGLFHVEGARKLLRDMYAAQLRRP